LRHFTAVRCSAGSAHRDRHELPLGGKLSGSAKLRITGG
jgi:hypothetical protein